MLRVPTPPAELTLVQCAAPQRSGVRRVQHYHFVGLLPTAVDGWSNITALVIAYYGAMRAGQRIFIRTCQQVDGTADVPKLVSVLIPPATP